jgi:tellurite resistance protein
MEPLNDEIGQLYAGALIAIARVDGEIGPEESAHLRDLVGKRTSVAIDYEASFFHKTRPEELAAAAKTGSVSGRELGKALAGDAVALAIADGDLNGKEAQEIIRFLRALGCTGSDVVAVTRELDEWLGELHA